MRELRRKGERGRVRESIEPEHKLALKQHIRYVIVVLFVAA
jgi:hypothetical protein